MTRLRALVMMSTFIFLVGLPASSVGSTSSHWPAVAFVSCQENNTVRGICDTSEAQRQIVIKHIFEDYGIAVADRTAEWSVDEVTEVQDALDSIAARFSTIVGHDAAPTLKALLHGAVLYRDNTSADQIAYTLVGEVSAYDLWTTYDQTGRTFYLAHEMGHLLDTRNSPLHLFMGEVSNEFAQAVGAYYDEQGRYQLGQNFPRHDSPGNIRHRSDGASEDWAESFATVMVPEFEMSLRNIGTARQSEVIRHLAEWTYVSEPVVLSTGSSPAVKAVTPTSSFNLSSGDMQPVAVRILHTWKQLQGGTLYEYRDESLGTIIASDLILTHNHYFRSMVGWREETYIFEDEWGRSVRWQPRNLQLMAADGGTMLIRLPVGAFLDRAVVAERASMARLVAGAWLKISYWDDAASRVVQRDFQITQVKDGIA